MATKKYQYGGYTGGPAYTTGAGFGGTYGAQMQANIFEQQNLQKILDDLKRQEAKGETIGVVSKMRKDFREEIEAKQRRARKKAKKYGRLGGLLSLGLSFIPGIGLWGAAGIQSLLGGLQAKMQQDAIKDAAKMKGWGTTFLEEEAEKYTKETKKLAKDFDPLAAAVESFGKAAAMGGISEAAGAKIDATKLKDAEKAKIDTGFAAGDVSYDLPQGGETLVSGDIIGPGGDLVATGPEFAGRQELASMVTSAPQKGWYDLTPKERAVDLFGDKETWADPKLGSLQFAKLLQHLGPILEGADIGGGDFDMEELISALGGITS